MSASKAYLTEQLLGEYLKLLSDDWVNDKSVPNSDSRSRPDYRSENLKLIVEFDGYHHYNSTARICKDYANNELYVSLGYKVIRIPYFIQMSTELLRDIFKVNIKVERTYEDGFIDSSALLPADFCEMGVQKFEQDLHTFEYAKESIYNTLRIKATELQSVELVVPKSLEPIIGLVHKWTPRRIKLAYVGEFGDSEKLTLIQFHDVSIVGDTRFHPRVIDGVRYDYFRATSLINSKNKELIEYLDYCWHHDIDLWVTYEVGSFSFKVKKLKILEEDSIEVKHYKRSFPEEAI